MSGYTSIVRGSAPVFDLSGMIATFHAWRARRQDIARITRELEGYSDGELAELGLGRGDIPAVARDSFARA